MIQGGVTSAKPGSDVERQALAALRKMRERLEAAEAREAAREAARHEPLAIVGMACKFPGAPDLEAFWALLERGGNAIVDIPPQRWSAEELARLGVSADSRVPRRAGLLPRIDLFDAEFFGITGREAQLMDPQQRLFLEVAWEALERAGIPPLALKGSRTGVFVGTTISDYLHLVTQRVAATELDAYLVSGNTINATAGRISYTLGLHGPAMAIDTACSSSLVAIDRACRSVREGESRLAIAGGVNIVLAPEILLSLARWGMLAPDGHCKVFDASANGFVRAEGCGVALIKRLADAVADGDRIWALVRGSAVNQAGASGAFAVPNGLAQAEVLRTALAAARVPGAEVAYLEAHGTGTSLGDPIEMEGITSVYGAQRDAAHPLWVGAVKSNVGHLEAAAGVTGLIKTVLALQHRQIPPNVHFMNPTPHIPWAEIAVRVPTHMQPFPAVGGRRLAAVSAFGFSGTNAHVVLEEAPPALTEAATAPAAAPCSSLPRLLLTISARSEPALRQLAAAHAGRLGALGEGDCDGEAAATHCLATSAARSHLSLRLAVTGSDARELAARLRAAASADEQAARAGPHASGIASGIARGRVGIDRPGVAFFFTGQGAQYAGMGRRLAEASPVFRAALQRCAELIDPLLGRPLLPLVFGEAAAATGEGDAGALLSRTAFTQPALFAIQVALVEWWRSVGVTPALVAGHSVGEFAAAWCAGVLTLEEAATLVAQRGALMQALPAGGAMAAISAGEDAVRARIQSAAADGLAGVLAVAGLNGPAESVVAGDAASVQRLAAAFTADGVRVDHLPVSHAFHSPLMEPMVERFAAVAERIRPATARLPAISSMTGAAADETWGHADYWLRQLRAPVRWFDVLRATAASDGIGIALEIGPQPVLTGLGRRALPDAALAWLPTLRRGQDDAALAVQTLAELYVLGAVDDWSGAAGAAVRAHVPLPVYPFQPTRHWVEPPRAQRRGVGHAASGTAGGPWCHPLLGQPLPLATGELVFQAAAGDERHAWVRDHRLLGTSVWPATASVEMLLAAGREATGGRRGGAVELREVEFQAPLVLPDDETVAVQTVVFASDGAPDRAPTPSTQTLGARLCHAPRAVGQPWNTFASARTMACLEAGASPASLPALATVQARCTDPADANGFHQQLAQAGADFGPAFRRLAELRRGPHGALALLQPIDDEATGDADAWLLHPALLDAALQLASVADFAGAAPPGGALWIPARIERVLVLEAGSDGARRDASAPNALREARPSPAALWGHAQLRAAAAGADGAATRTADVTLWRADGTPLARLEGVQFLRGQAAGLLGAAGAGAASSLIERCALQWAWEHDGSAAPADIGAMSWQVVDASNAAAGAREFDASRGLDGEEPSAWTASLAAALRALGHPPHAASAGTRVPGQLPQQVVCLAAPPASVLTDDASPSPLALQALCAGYDSVLHTLRGLAAGDALAAPAPRLWIVTRGAQAVRGSEIADPFGAALWGLARVVRAERPDVQCTVLDVEPGCSVADLATALRHAATQEARESQLAWRDGALWRARLAAWPAAATQDFRFVAPRSGRIEDLQSQPCTVPPPGAGEVCIEVRAAGLNFRDVLASLGMVASPVDALGGECAGRIGAVGEGVTGFAPGDEVMALAIGGMATRVCVPQQFVAHRPAGLPAALAAGLPIACLTASHGLEDLAGLRRGQRVLVHAATGGVGMAAVQLARALGAEVYATAGSEAKRERLRAMGVRHVFDSRRLDFARELRAANGGAGVHVVLNALAGDFIAAGLSALEPGGCFLEMGKRGVWSAAQVAERFPGMGYHVFDLGDAAAADATLAPRLFARLLARLAARELMPLPCAPYPMREARAAFQAMAHASHIGKLVLVRDDSAPALATTVRADASYLVTGGFGALGLVLAEALVERGARHLWLLGRQAAPAAAAEVLARLAARGVTVQRLHVDVVNAQALHERLTEAQRGAPPLAGVVHCAGRLDDGVLARQDSARLTAVLAPKLQGGLNLAAATRAAPLDFFVLFSAGAAWLGMPGQANYAAANAAVDALAQRLRAQGCPATAIAWGRWAGAGMAAAARGEDESATGWATLGIGEIAPVEGAAAMFECIDRQATSVAVLPMDWPTHLRRLHGGDAAQVPACFDRVAGRTLHGRPAGTNVDARQGASASPAAGPRGGPSPLVQLQATAPHQRRETLQAMLQTEVRKVAGLPERQPIDPAWPLRELGLDSLMSVELRNALGALFGRTLSATLVFDHPTLNAITDLLMTTLPGLTEPTAPEAAQRAATRPAATAPARGPLATAEVQALSEEEAEAQLLAELARGGS